MNPDFNKYSDKLLPVVVQDVTTNKVLMLGFMNAEAFSKTLTEKRLTFFSRSKNRLWTKGETSGNYLDLVEYILDCDADTVLMKVNPCGPVCHNGTDTCFNEKNENSTDFLFSLERIIKNRKENPDKNSYTSQLFERGINKIAQKVGEEAVELVIEAKDNDKDLFLNEAADLLYHYIILLQAKNFNLEDVINVLKSRNK